MSTTEPATPDNTDEDEVLAAKIKAMKDEELLDFIRGTVVRLEALADRLDRFADDANPPPKE